MLEQEKKKKAAPALLAKLIPEPVHLGGREHKVGHIAGPNGLSPRLEKKIKTTINKIKAGNDGVGVGVGVGVGRCHH